MRILLVDDERYILRNTERIIREHMPEVKEVYTACDTQSAREILLSTSVDLMICDIEMPQESGLDLLLWMGDHTPGIASIVLTCHANFEYIRKAMHLRVEDYLVKPVPPDELISAIQKAVTTSLTRAETREDASYGKYWRENTEKLHENFWTNIVNGVIPSDIKSIQEEAEKLHISLDTRIQYVPILFRSVRKMTEQEERTTLTLRVALSGLLSNSFSSVTQEKQVLTLEPETLLCVLSMPEEADWMRIRSGIMEDCGQIIGSAETFLSCRLYCYFDGRKTYSLTELMDARLRLETLAREDVVRKDRVYILGEDGPLVGTARIPNLNILAVLLMEGSYGRAKQELIDLLDRRDADHSFIIRFYQSFIQMFASVLEHHNVTFQQITESADSGKIRMETLQEFQETLLKMIDNLSQYKGQTTAVAEVTQYIDAHLDAKLSREQLAAMVYLSPDHLNRIFKQEHGRSIYEYIVDKRMTLAAQMLETTDLKMHAIALNTGYNNFSQFSKAFKDKYGANPRDYRKKHQTSH